MIVCHQRRTGQQLFGQPERELNVLWGSCLHICTVCISAHVHGVYVYVSIVLMCVISM